MNSKSSPGYPIPSRLVKECFDELKDVPVFIINKFVKERRLPGALKKDASFQVSKRKIVNQTTWSHTRISPMRNILEKQ